MKKTIFSLALLSLLFFLGCKEEHSTPCTGECLFTMEDAEGKMTQMACFDRFAVATRHPETDSTIYGILDEVPSAYQVEGKTVKFSATFRENKLQPTFPDPSVDPGTLFQATLSDIR
jgi:hypothetical protein